MEVRGEALKKAFELHPERFKGKMPRPAEVPKAIYINKPMLDLELKEAEAGNLQ